MHDLAERQYRIGNDMHSRIDFQHRQRHSGDPIRLLDWEVIMAFLAMAFPIPANKLDEWKSFVAQLAGAKRVDFAASRKRFRVRERIFHQQTSHGDFAIVTLEGEDPADAFAKFGQGTDTFAQWYTACVLEIHGTELGKTPPDSFSALVVDSGSGQGDIFSDLAKWFG